MTGGRLIFDVGANDGNDTAYYLGLGHAVVAIEADPVLAVQLGERFSTAIAAGLVTVVNVAVTEQDGEAVELFVAAKSTESSIIRTMAERSGALRGKIALRGRSLCSLFEEFGLPWYCKIDIEGYDARAIAGMSACAARPAYLSCEASGQPIAEVGNDEGLLYEGLNALADQGYRQFKLVDQESLLVLGDAGHYDRLHSWPVRIRTKLDRWSKRKKAAGPMSDSGPFGEDLTGEWADYNATRRRLRRHFYHYYQYTKNKQFIFWVDIHGKY